jgi:hypothetical protein
VKRLREAGAIILAKANLGEMGSPNSRSSFGGPSIGRLPSEPYRGFANERTLNGMRIGVIREHMDKKLFTESHAETIDIVERGINDLRGLGATIVDPGPGGALFQSCLEKYIPLYRSRTFVEQHPDLFPVDADGKPSADRIPQLVDMFFDPSLVPGGSSSSQAMVPTRLWRASPSISRSSGTRACAQRSSHISKPAAPVPIRRCARRSINFAPSKKGALKCRILLIQERFESTAR